MNPAACVPTASHSGSIARLVSRLLKQRASLRVANGREAGAIAWDRATAARGMEGALRRCDTMQQLILTSVMLATFAIPVLVARRRAPGGYGAVLGRLLAFVAVYVVLLIVVYPRLF
jgi:hypothetical protein